VAHLAEIEERRLHLQAGFSSMFEFCTKDLGLGDGEAFRRILAARLGRRFPAIYSLLMSGAVHLSALEMLRERLTEENHEELLCAVSGKSKREVEALLAARFPRPDVPSRIRKLPSGLGQRAPVESDSEATFELEPCASDRNWDRNRALIEPLSEARFRVEFTASADLREKLELCRDLMSHANPSRDLGAVVERAVDLLLADLEKKRLGRTNRPRRKPSTRTAKQGRVASGTRRKVYERDGLRCTYVSIDGRRCESRAFLELDHAEPRALGGGDDSANLRVLCRSHNQLLAEQAFGREHIEHKKHFRQKKCIHHAGGGKDEARDAESALPAPLPTLDKVRNALRNMGFQDAQARHAIAKVARMHDKVPPIEQALREALLVATATSR
jgi:5-methylcytosine-specific restriction endonuclease McrA